MKRIIAICLLISATFFNGLRAKETYLHRIIKAGELDLAYEFLKDKMIRYLCNGEWIYSDCKSKEKHEKFLEILTKIQYKLAKGQEAFVNSQEQFGDYLSSGRGIRDLIRLIANNREFLINSPRVVRLEVLEDGKFTGEYKLKNINLSHEEIDFLLKALSHIKGHMDDALDMKHRYYRIAEAFEVVFNLATNNRASFICSSQELLDHALPSFHDPRLVHYVNELDEHGQTLLHLAAKLHAYKLVALLIFCGSYRFAQDNDGNTPMHVLINSIPSLLVDHLSDEHTELLDSTIQPAIITFLNLFDPQRDIADGDLFNVPNYNGKTAMHLLARHPEGAGFINILRKERVAIEDNNVARAQEEAEAKVEEILSKLSDADRVLFKRFANNASYISLMRQQR